MNTKASYVNFSDPDLFTFDDSFASLSHLSQFSKKAIEKAKKDIEETRHFARNHLHPLVLNTDLSVQQDKDALAHDILNLAVEHKMLTRPIPKFLGGNSSGVMFSVNPCIEEISAVDPAFHAGVMAGHGLGLVALMISQNIEIMERVALKIVGEENAGRPYMIDCAITEPMAGTDVEEFALLPHAKLVSHARKVDNGAILNGNKCFISGGHFANLHVVIMPFDLTDPTGSLSMFLVPRDSPGFKLGRVEDKMGMKAGSASELLFNDCFVPDENIVYIGSEMPAEYREKVLHSVLGITRIAVGAMGTGVARGAFEAALHFAKNHNTKGKPIIHQQWAQEVLTNMLMNVYASRSVYLEAGFVLFTTLSPGQTPSFFNTKIFEWLYNTPVARKFRYSQGVKDYMLNQFFGKPDLDMQRLQFFSSLAKVFGSDTGMKNCHMAIEFMGEYGLRHDSGVEKLFRDIKLCQIFEGTNQLNRLNMFNHFIARNIPGISPF